MNIVELIEKLEAIREEEGDNVEVVVTDDDGLLNKASTGVDLMRWSSKDTETERGRSIKIV